MKAIDRDAFSVIIGGAGNCLHRRVELVAVPGERPVACLVFVKKAIAANDVSGLVLES